MREIEVEIRIQERTGKCSGYAGTFRKRITTYDTLCPGTQQHEEFCLSETEEKVREWAQELCVGKDYGLLAETLPEPRKAPGCS